MALRFQGESDDAELEANRAKKGLLVTLLPRFVLAAVFGGLVAWISGYSLHSYERFLEDGAGCVLVFWVFSGLFSK